MQEDKPKRMHTIPKMTEDEFRDIKSSIFPTTNSQPLNILISIASLPLQVIAIFLLSRIIQISVLSINEVYEATGRRARSKFATFPWTRVIIGVSLLAVYHVGLVRLTVRSWKGLRRGG
jgi:hypothetical protein